MKYIIPILLLLLSGCNEKKASKIFKAKDSKDNYQVNNESINKTINYLRIVDSSVLVTADSTRFGADIENFRNIFIDSTISVNTFPWLFGVYHYNLYSYTCSKQYKSSLYFFKSNNKLGRLQIDSFFSKINLGMGAMSSGFKEFYSNDSAIVLHFCIVDRLESHICTDKLLNVVKNSLLNFQFERIDVVARGYGHTSLK